MPAQGANALVMAGLIPTAAQIFRSWAISTLHQKSINAIIAGPDGVRTADDYLDMAAAAFCEPG